MGERMPDPSAGWCAALKFIDQYVDGRVRTFVISCTRKLHHTGEHAFRWGDNLR